MAGILDALNLVATSAEANEKKPQKQSNSTLTPDYVNKNKQDIAKTFQYDADNDYNAKIRKALGLGN